MTFLLAVLVRAVALGVVVGLYYAMLPLLFPPTPGDANIGAGLIGFAVLALAAGIGGLLDGRRRPLGRVAPRWLVVGVVLGVGWSVVLPLAEGAIDAASVLSFVATLTPFCVIVVGLPACAGAAVGAATRRTGLS